MICVVTYEGAQNYLPTRRSLPELSEAAAHCHGCDLFAAATQTVFGEGAEHGRIVLVGETPGDREDREGRPFVGPAGGVLDRALRDAGIDRGSAYLTNAVKHFRFTRGESGRRRIHKTPSRSQIAACRPWLLAELDTVLPEIVVALGATAARSLFGDDFRVSARRGLVFDPGLAPRDARVRAPKGLATLHPSAVLRARGDDRDDAYRGLVADLEVAAAVL